MSSQEPALLPASDLAPRIRRREVSPVEVGEQRPDHLGDRTSSAEFSYPFDMSWSPAASLPCGFTAEVLPVGLQIVGRRFDERGMLQMSRAFEKVSPWADKRPALD